MMQLFALLNAAGVPDVVSTTSREGMVEVPEGIDPMTHMVVSETWQPRPSVQVHGANGEIMLTRIPAQTRIEIVDLEIGAMIIDQIIDGDETLSFEDAGRYQIEVIPPMPFIGWRGVLQC